MSAAIPAEQVALVVIAKAPVPGRAKTRLIPALGPEGSAALAEAALADTLAAVERGGAGRRVVVLDGDPGPWLPAGFDVVPQVAGGLGRRLSAAFAAAGGPAFLVGMDTPQLTPDLIDAAVERLCAERVDAVLGLAEDGGWWGLGLRRPDPGAFEGVRMSERTTGEEQTAALERLGLRLGWLPRLRDVDTIEDARAVAALAPHSRFARALERLEVGAA